METVRLERPTTGANAPEHRIGAGLDTNDQLSSVVLLGIALAGSAVASLLLHLVGG